MQPVFTKSRAIRLAVFAIALLATSSLGILALLKGWVDIDSLQRWVAGQGLAAMASFVGLAIVMELFWLPRMWGLIAGGLLFGAPKAIALTVIADLVAAIAMFWFARAAGREVVARLVAKRPKLEQLVEMLARRRGLWTMFLLRALPIPYTGGSYASALAGVRFRDYVLGTALGILPGTLIFTVVGVNARDPSKPGFWIGMIVTAATVLLGLFLLRRFWLTYRRTVRASS
jgi:uncharacterized membrane protein YdjX (TVP38/TMEM64 family)